MENNAPSFNALDMAMKKFDQIEDSEFPNFLFKPRLNALSDDAMTAYEQKLVMDDPRLLKIRTNKAQISNVWEWIEKHTIWVDYINDMVDKYGSLELVMEGARTGSLPDFIPLEPKLKRKKSTVKRFLKYGELPPRKGEEFSAIRFLQSVPDPSPEVVNSISEANEELPMDEATATLFERACSKTDIHFRRAGLRRGTNENVGHDFVLDYYSRHGSNVSGTKDQGFYEDGGPNGVSLFDEIRKMEDLEATPDWILDSELSSKTQYKIDSTTNTVVDAVSQRQTEFYKMIVNAGWTPKQIEGLTNSDHLDDGAMRVIYAAVGQDAASQMESMKKYSKKERKRLKKERKRQQDEYDRYNRTSASISSLIAANKFNTGEWSGSPLSWFAQRHYGK